MARLVASTLKYVSKDYTYTLIAIDYLTTNITENDHIDKMDILSCLVDYTIDDISGVNCLL